MFGAIAKGTTVVHNFLQGADCRATIHCFRNLGIEIEDREDSVIVHGKGLHGLQAPTQLLDVGNSGTTTRLIAGIAPGSHFDSNFPVMIRQVPVNEDHQTLWKWGQISQVFCTTDARLCISHRLTLHRIHYDSPVASAGQSCILLSGLYADGETTVTEPALSRNHTELMLREFGADIRFTPALDSTKATASIRPCEELYGQTSHSGRHFLRCLFLRSRTACSIPKFLVQNIINPTPVGF